MAPDLTFIDCPLTPGCPAKIPRRMTCSGQKVPWHRGLDYQGCNTCGGFQWKDPNEVAAAERRAMGAPANGASPFPPPDEPPNPYACSPEIPYPDIDPTLISSSRAPPGLAGSMYLPPTASPPPPPPSQPRSQPVLAHSSSKPLCSAQNCTRKAGSKECSYGMCKACCERQRKGCRYLGHRTPPTASLAPTFTLGDPSELARPPPMFPTATPPTTLANSTPADPLPPKVYKKAMNEEWARRYNATHEQRELRKLAEEQRRQQQFQYEREVRICCWMEDGDEPDFIRVQGITTFPKLNLADHPKALEKLGLATTSEISLYDPYSCSFHREDVNHVMEVTAHQVILARLRGVKDCPKLDEYIAKYTTHRSQATGSRRPLASTPLKRKAAVDTFPSVLKTTRPSAFSRPTTPPSPPRSVSPSPSAGSSSPSQSSSSPSLPSTSTSVSAINSVSLLSSATADPDLLWAQGQVLVPSGFGAWPDGLYARDMARAFGLVNRKQTNAPPISQRFQTVFPSVSKFPKQTWYQQLKAWKACTQAERDEAEQLPRTHAGLWTVWRASSSGWAVVASEKRH
ncbi:hypothetical protein R3P38DRAFT_2526064 [Favolaschia claudopus]|uniref:Uncharacterized protein n=1 Tax=Favolaschia claudopus TaxID=2862362 RepID=A0AAW0BPM4_9AGAR